MMSSEVKKDNFLCYDGIKAAVAIRSELLSLSFGSGVFCIIVVIAAGLPCCSSCGIQLCGIWIW